MASGDSSGIKTPDRREFFVNKTTEEVREYGGISCLPCREGLYLERRATCNGWAWTMLKESRRTGRPGPAQGPQ